MAREILGCLNRENCRRILEEFTLATQIRANIVDRNGISIFSRKDFGSCCQFCQTIYNSPGGLERCRQAYKVAGHQACQSKSPFMFQCPAGLIEMAFPIERKGKHLGSLICGQVLLWEPDATLYQEIDSLNKGNMPDVSRLLKSLESLPVIPEEKLRAYSCFLSVVLDTMMQGENK
ncbi:MAG TPA: PocR ligand-binding domain-containing protein [Candidatus Blautia avistercoris]|nr:PocR ligand-binding domain-containing protein [Candidatus Blautia avistercoris]